MILILAVASPTLGLVLSFSSGERFSELWLLGSDHMADNYPFNVRAGEEYDVIVGVSCHMGRSAYYAVYVKLRSQTQPLPNASAAVASPVDPECEYRFVVAEDNTWESKLTFEFSDVSVHDNVALVRHLSLNGITFEVNSTSLWDSDGKGFFYQLFFELWMYDTEAKSLEYNNRFVGLWLNITV
jgi:uncharacterized membrane protein